MCGEVGDIREPGSCTYRECLMVTYAVLVLVVTTGRYLTVVLPGAYCVEVSVASNRAYPW